MRQFFLITSFYCTKADSEGSKKARTGEIDRYAIQNSILDYRTQTD